MPEAAVTHSTNTTTMGALRSWREGWGLAARPAGAPEAVGALGPQFLVRSRCGQTAGRAIGSPQRLSCSAGSYLLPPGCAGRTLWSNHTACPYFYTPRLRHLRGRVSRR
uniref:Tumor necrosis factor receptor superfamily member 10B-like n=1 Tax=Sus scrofa TaxID=9823 RepID=A0A480IPF9_PIG